jgi:hypothetical protein
MSSNHFAVLADHDIDLTGEETTAPLPNATSTPMKSQPSKTPKILKCEKAQKTRAPPQDKSSDEEKFADAEGWDDESYSRLSVGHEDANAYGIDEGTVPMDTEQTLCTAFTIFETIWMLPNRVCRRKKPNLPHLDEVVACIHPVWEINLECSLHYQTSRTYVLEAMKPT